MLSQHSINQKLRREGILLPLYNHKEVTKSLSLPNTYLGTINKAIVELVRDFKLKHPEAKLYATSVIDAEYDEDEYQTYEVLGEILAVHAKAGHIMVRDNPVREEHDWSEYYAYWPGDGKNNHVSLHPELTETADDKLDCLWIGYDSYVTQIYIDGRSSSNHMIGTVLDRIER